jgi:hypothetical protein
MDSGWQTAVNKRGPKRLGAPQKRYALCLVDKVAAKQSGRKNGPLLSNAHLVVYSFSTFEFSRNVCCYLHRCHLGNSPLGHNRTSRAFGSDLVHMTKII